MPEAFDQAIVRTERTRVSRPLAGRFHTADDRGVGDPEIARLEPPHRHRDPQESLPMAERKPIDSWLTDMDGVLIHEGVPIPGADAFIKRLRESGKPFLVLT